MAQLLKTVKGSCHDYYLSRKYYPYVSRIINIEQQIIDILIFCDYYLATKA